MDKLLELLSIKTQCIWLKGDFEKQLMVNAINSLSKFDVDRIFTWSCISQIEELVIQENNFKCVPVHKDLNKPINVFFSILQNGSQVLESSDNYAIILRDYDLVIDNPNYLRIIREIAEANHQKYIPIIITSDKYDPPAKLKHLFSVVTDKDPAKEEIITLLNNYEISRGISIDKDKDIVATKLLGFNKIEIIQILDLSYHRFREVNLDIITEKKIDFIKNTEVLDYKVPKASLTDIGGNDNFKRWFEEVKYCMTDEALDYGIDRPKGYLALGLPGCSKTILAEAIANDLSVPFLQLNMSKILSKFVGDSERKIEQAINLINSCAPCVLLIDEVEKNLGGN